MCLRTSAAFSVGSYGFIITINLFQHIPDARLSLSEEELALFVDPTLSKPEEKTVKKVAKELLEILKGEKLVLDWRKRQQARAAVRLCIEQFLDQLPPTYTTDVYQQKCNLTYQHIYDAYFGQGRSIYHPGA